MATTDEIKRSVTDRLLMDDRVFPADISVDVTDATVKLSGTVPTYTSLRAAEEDVRYVPGVQKVENKLKVSLPEEITAPTDDEIADRISSIFSWHENLRSFKLSLEVERGWVTLQGSVDSYWRKILAEDLAFSVTGVIEVSNEITIVPTGDATDKSIAREIKEKIKQRQDLEVENIDVKVANGEVTLSGIARSNSEALAAYDAAIYTRGVTHVVDEIVQSKEEG